MESILNIWDIPAFVGFIDGGYITKYINGTDLHGNKPFNGNIIDDRCVADIDQIQQVDVIFSNAIRVGETLGYTLGDITCGNIMVDTDVYLIDFDVIVKYPLHIDYQ